jgi:hypothetical protein
MEEMNETGRNQGESSGVSDLKIYAVVPVDDNLPGAGPFTDRTVAETALKILQMAVDPESSIIECDVDEHAAELKAGLRPWLVSIDLEAGRVIGKPRMTLCWPPREEGIIFENPGLRECFVWARSQNEIILKLPRLKRVECQNNSCEVEAEG